MLTTPKALFAFVDFNDPFIPSEIAREGQPGPILSILATRKFEALFLFCTPHARRNAEETAGEVSRRHPACLVQLHELNVSDPKDYSALMGRLAREVRPYRLMSGESANFVCVSSGTAEMRTAWFILVASGVLPATMLQIGSPAEPLFGAADVKEVDLQSSDWQHLRDLIMPMEYFERDSQSVRMRLSMREDLPTAINELESSPSVEAESASVESRRIRPRLRESWRPIRRDHPTAVESPLDEALRELNIFVGSPDMRQTAERASIAASASNSPILLTGETDTGKEVFARLVHRMSARRSREMICINCAAIPKELVESHLFGHVKGAFTGAGQDQMGKFERAHGGTLFLDEVGELTLEAKAKLLRVLQDGVVERVGSNQPKEVDVWIVAATNRDLKQEIVAGRFRDDIYYRLEVASIHLPPLRERTSEIPDLAVALLQQINQRHQTPRQPTKEVMKRLVAHKWAGNVRELYNVLQRSVLFAKTGLVYAADLDLPLEMNAPDPLRRLPEPTEGFGLHQFLAAAKLQLVQRALVKSDGNQTAAAKLLGITKQSVSKIVAPNGNTS